MAKVVIAIPTYRRPKQLLRLLASIDRMHAPSHDVSIVVFDNDAELEEGRRSCADLTLRFPLQVLTVAERGLSAVRNAMLDLEFDRLAMVDDDEEVSETWLTALLAENADVVSGPLYYRLPEGTPDAIRKCFRLRHEESATNYSTGNLLIRSGLAERFDPAFSQTGGEDWDWLSRLRASGATFGWAADAIAYEHVPPERATPRWLFRRYFRTGGTRCMVDGKQGKSRVVSVLDALAVIGTAPFLYLVLPRERKLLRLLKSASAAGYLVSFLGFHYREYA